ncbi:MAG: alpha-1,2-fucosyltransferase [Candidatus Paceibacterota bacterium]|jgi:hypothetical protein
MIITKLSGGLGNQLFQYAFGRSVSLQKKAELKFDVSSLQKNIPGITKREYNLSVFSIPENFATEKEIAKFQKYKRKPGKKWFIYNRLIANNKKYFQERKFHFDEKVFDVSSDCYFEGWWQTEKYFKNIEEIIRKEIVVKIPLSGKNAETAKNISSVNAVALHIRRGDYVSNAETNDALGTFGPEYYKKAVGIIAEKVPNPHLFVFSDDHEWVKKNIVLPYPTTYVDHNDTDKNYEDLRLMSQCKHFVIANSSFSWWGAWLSQNPNKIVIGPKKWFNNVKPSVKTDDIMPENWTRI